MLMFYPIIFLTDYPTLMLTIVILSNYQIAKQGIYLAPRFIDSFIIHVRSAELIESRIILLR